jgi:serine phosphatase RsbU (regulator of sigma subunit)/pSer/pThr/pTyr-binding forkhead associated (FHA) protein
MQPQQGPKASLTIRTPDGKSLGVPLEKDTYTLGRSSATDLCYADDSGLSRQHLSIDHLPSGGWAVRDLGSKNGTVVNGSKLGAEAFPLHSGDRISAGHLIIEFQSTAVAIPTNTVVFVERASEPITAATTVQASLEGLMGPGQEKFDPSKTHVMQGNPQVRALVRAARELTSHRTLAEVFEVIMDLSMEAVAAGRGVLMTLEGGNLEVRAARGQGFQISSAVRDRVIKDRASILVRDTSLEEAFRERKSIVAQQIRSLLAVPLQTNDRVIGLIYLDSPNMIRQFTKEDLNLLTVMANVAAIRIETARLNEVEQNEKFYAKELSQAAQIQQGLLPACAPVVPGYELSGYNAPCRTVGGDYYDFLPFPDGKIGLIVADVSGKGLPASLMMTSLQARVHVLFEDGNNLSQKVTKLNNAVARNCPAGKFITFFMGVLDPATGEFVYCNAGHNPPLLVRADGTVDKLDAGGIVLGILPFSPYEEQTAVVGPGDVIVLYSDGVTEQFAPDADEEFGEDRLGVVVASNRSASVDALIGIVNDAVTGFTHNAPPADDFTLLLARRSPVAGFAPIPGTTVTATA